MVGLDVDGAAISLLTASRLRETLWAGDAIAELLEDLPFSLGEGVCIEASVTGRPVLVPDLSDTAQTSRWSIYAAAVVSRLGSARPTPSLGCAPVHSPSSGCSATSPTTW